MTGYSRYTICSPAPGHRDLLAMFQDDLDTDSKLLAHLDKRACWDQHKQERIARLYDIADRCLNASQETPRACVASSHPECVHICAFCHPPKKNPNTVNELTSTSTPPSPHNVPRTIHSLVPVRGAYRMPKGGQTGDPYVRPTFPHTGLAGEGSVGRRIVMMQFRLNSNQGRQVY